MVIKIISGLWLVVITLKLTETIDWPWLWVMGPLWVPPGVLFVFVTVAVLVAIFKGLCSDKSRRTDNNMQRRNGKHPGV
tara:strand:+ start:241 stop:477 length:237 start_codon:yes stop_codon:yes gene_type:complete